MSHEKVGELHCRHITVDERYTVYTVHRACAAYSVLCTRIYINYARYGCVHIYINYARYAVRIFT